MLSVDELAAEVASCLGVDEVKLVAAPMGGAAHLAYEVHDPKQSAADPVAFLRCETESTVPSGYGLGRETTVLRVAHRLGLPVPEVLGTPGQPPGLLMNMVAGTSRPSAEEIEAVGAAYLELVAEVHRTDPTEFGLEPVGTITEAIAAELERWTRFCEQTRVFEVPLMRAAARILTSTLPHDDARPSLVHGDVGAGNFMTEGGKVTAMLDWELAHVGDPHEDMAWLWMRGAHTSFGDPALRLAEYERAAGWSLDRQRLQWHLAFVMFKSSAGMYAATQQPVGDATLVQTMVILTYDALLASHLMRVLGSSFQLLTNDPVRRAGLGPRMAERALQSTELSKESRILVSYLRDSIAQSPWEHEQLAADRRQYLGTDQGELLEAVNTAADTDLLAVATVLARAADRAAMALPNAVRRIERAQRIGLGTALALPERNAP
jgi:aminoglycoside phosphotransferase (APT) family kinase protein